MRAALLAATFSALLLAGMSGAPGCFEPELGTVAFRCGDAGLCPDDYYCGQDGCCHKNGSDPAEHGACLVWEDAAVAQDAAATQDGSPTADASP